MSSIGSWESDHCKCVIGSGRVGLDAIYFSHLVL